MADEAPIPSAPTAPTRGAGWKHAFGEPLSRVQTIVATLTGIISIVGAVYSMAPFARSTRTGELVATVQEAGSHRGITGATIEVLTVQNEIVATLTPDATGRATRDLTEGSYIVRITHPRYAAETRRVQVLS